LTALYLLLSRMKAIVDGFHGVHLMNESAMHPPAPRSGRHAALFLLAGRSPPRRLVLPGSQTTAPACPSNGRF